MSLESLFKDAVRQLETRQVPFAVAGGVAVGMNVGKVPLALPTLRSELGLSLVQAGWVSSMLTTLAASASYIAVPAAMRIAVPEANPAISLAGSLGVTFPFNILLGIPLYHWMASQWMRP